MRLAIGIVALAVVLVGFAGSVWVGIVDRDREVLYELLFVLVILTVPVAIVTALIFLAKWGLS